MDIEFDYDGHTYRVPERACLLNTDFELPDGRILLVTQWQKTSPPRPVKFQELTGWVSGTATPNGSCLAELVR